MRYIRIFWLLTLISSSVYGQLHQTEFTIMYPVFIDGVTDFYHCNQSDSLDQNHLDKLTRQIQSLEKSISKDTNTFEIDSTAEYIGIVSFYYHHRIEFDGESSSQFCPSDTICESKHTLKEIVNTAKKENRTIQATSQYIIISDSSHYLGNCEFWTIIKSFYIKNYSTK